VETYRGVVVVISDVVAAAGNDQEAFRLPSLPGGPSRVQALCGSRVGLRRMKMLVAASGGVYIFYLVLPGGQCTFLT
jgi:hypothetical protein